MAAKVLENISGRMRVFILSGAHLETHPTHEHRYKPVKTVTVHQSKGGHLVARTLARAMPDSLRLAAGEAREVDELVLHCPHVKQAIARGELRVSDPKPKTAEPKEPKEPKEPRSSSSHSSAPPSYGSHPPPHPPSR